jgi:hypothetical protein
MEELKSGLTFFKNLESLQALLLTLCEGQDDSINFQNFANAFFKLCTKENSLIYKQILKQNYPPFQDPKQWPDFYRRSMEFYTNRLPDEFVVTKETLKHTINDLPNIFPFSMFDKFSDKDITRIQNNWIFLFNAVSSLLDIYTIARIWKQPDGGPRSSLSFCYFGNLHVQNIVDLLVSTNAYELVFSMPMKTDPISRCQTFDFRLNLTQEVRKHNKKIKRE